jgi:lipid-A-disaccharide synthase
MRYFFSAGEPSGDLHAAKLIRELARLDPTFEARGLCGPHMKSAGCHQIFQLTDLAVMGLWKVLPALGKFYRVFKLAQADLAAHRPDAVVLVDFPGFNWHIAAAAKSLGIPVIYWLPPQLWAWAPWRIRKVRRNVDLVLCALPFEYDWYQQRGVNARFVGSPFFDEVDEKPLDPVVMSTLSRQAESGDRLVAVLPGSRRHEVVSNFPIQIRIMRKLAAQVPGCRFVIANLNEEHRRMCAELLAEDAPAAPVDFRVAKTSEVIAAAEVVLMKSGSVSLEVMARHKPAVVLYRMSRIGYFFGQLFLTCRYISLPNLIAGRAVMPEYVPAHPTGRVADEVTERLRTWLEQPLERARVTNELTQLHTRSHVHGATLQAAQEIVGFVDQRTLPSRIAA